jgi:hypothetical protein
MLLIIKVIILKPILTLFSHVPSSSRQSGLNLSQGYAPILFCILGLHFSYGSDVKHKVLTACLISDLSIFRGKSVSKYVDIVSYLLFKSAFKNVKPSLRTASCHNSRPFFQLHACLPGHFYV